MYGMQTPKAVEPQTLRHEQDCHTLSQDPAPYLLKECLLGFCRV